MFENQIPPARSDGNLKNYDQAYAAFSWEDANEHFTWHRTGRLNIAFEAIDRHAGHPGTAHRSCIIYTDDSREENITYARMRALSNRFGNALRKLGVKKKDRVFLFLPRVPELYIALVGCAKIGAVVAPLYSDFRQEALRERMLDGQGRVLVTTPNLRGRVPADELPDLEHIILVGAYAQEAPEGDLLWDELMQDASDELIPEWVEKDFPLFLIYTSGANGRPIGLVHPHDAMRGYLMTARWVLDLKDGDTLWTQSRPGWLLNVVYSAFAPWLCGVQTFVAGGSIRSADDICRHIQQNRISVLYAAPSFYRMLAAAGEEITGTFNLQSLRHLVSVLEPLYPSLIYAIMRVLGVPVYDTWWSAETGMITIANLPCLPIKPGYLGKPVPGIQAAILDQDGNEVPPFTMGELALKTGWPAMVRGVWGHEQLYRDYVRQKPWFRCGDIAFMDQDNYYFYQGRADDVMVTSGGRVGTAEIENVLLMHPAVAEAGVIKVVAADKTKKLKAFIALRPRYRPSPLLKKKIMSYVQNHLSPEAALQDIVFHESLPKDRDGKVLRIVLKAWELGLPTGAVTDLM